MSNELAPQLRFNKDTPYKLSVCVSSKVMKREKKVLFEERNVVFMGYMHDSKYKLLTFKRLYPKPDVKEHFHIKADYIHSVEQL